jgi:DNA/RNA-binding domain of Phe-tRNA-synthetase-like protein
MDLSIEEAVRKRYPDLFVPYASIHDVTVQLYSRDLLSLKAQILTKVRSQYDLVTLKDRRGFRAYRDFFWGIGIDATKIRPAGEALIRRVLRGGEVPSINTLVDAYNLASIETGIALAAFDLDQTRGFMTLRFSETGEEFLGIGMTSPIVLKGGEVVVSDREGVLAIYPYRDAERSRVQLTTTSAIILACGVPGIGLDSLKQSLSISVEYIARFCGGVAHTSP